MKSASLAITPLMLAERDREFLKQLRKNRDAEEKLMKDKECLGGFHFQEFTCLMMEDGSWSSCESRF